MHDKILKAQILVLWVMLFALLEQTKDTDI